MAEKRCIIRMPRTARGKLLGALVLLAVLAAAALAIRGVVNAGRKPDDSITQRLEEAARGLNAYDVTLRLDEDEGAVAISEILSFRNDTGDSLDHLVLRFWLNAFRTEETSPAALEEVYDDCYPNGFSPGYVTVYDVIWNGERAEYSWLDDAQTAMRVSIPGLEDGGEGKLTLRCVTYLPECAHRSGRMGRDYQLGNVIPLLARYQDGQWRTDAYSPIGDPFVSDCANFSITLFAPEDLTVACSAELTRGEDGSLRGKLLAARDAALCLSPDYRVATGQAGEIRVYSCAKTEAGAKRALSDACRALETYDTLYGPYPYPAFTVCSVDFPFGGMEYPGLCMIGAGGYLESRADSLELTIAHETAHQWFYALVGSDQVNDPWQDESACEYAMLRYVRKRYGQGSFETLKSYRVDAPMQESIPGSLTPGSPIDYYGNLSDYAAVVYGRGTALWLALDEILPGGVDAFLRAYADAFAFRFTTRAEFEEFLNGYAGMDLRPLLLDYLDTVF